MDTIQNPIQEPVQIPTSQPKPNYLIVIVSSILGIILLTLITFLYSQNQKLQKQIINQKNIPTITTTPIPASVLTPKFIGNYDVDVRINPSSPCITDTDLRRCKSDVYLKDKQTGKEIFVFTTDNDVKSVKKYGNIHTYKNGYIFIMKRTGNEEYPSNDWIDELWVYTDANHGRKLYAAQNLQYQVNKNATMIALRGGYLPSDYVSEHGYSGSYDVEIVAIEANNKIKTYSIDIQSCIPNTEVRRYMGELGLNQWDNKDSFWGTFLGEYGVVGCYWKLNLLTGEISYYPMPNDIFTQHLSFDPDKMEFQYSGKPAFMLDLEGRKKWEESHSTYSIYSYSLLTKKSTVIKTVPSKE